jgi:hypothetical protein
MVSPLFTQLTPHAQAQLHTLCASVFSPRENLTATMVNVLLQPTHKPQHAQIMLRPRIDQPPCLQTLWRLGSSSIVNGMLCLTSLCPPHAELWEAVSSFGPSHWGVHEPMLHRSLSRDPRFEALYRELRGLYRSELARQPQGGKPYDLGVERLSMPPQSGPDALSLHRLTAAYLLPPGPYTVHVHHRAGNKPKPYWIRVYSAEGIRMVLDPASLSPSNPAELWIPDPHLPTGPAGPGAYLSLLHARSSAGQDALSRLLVHMQGLTFALPPRRKTTPATDFLLPFEAAS